MANVFLDLLSKANILPTAPSIVPGLRRNAEAINNAHDVRVKGMMDEINALKQNNIIPNKQRYADIQNEYQTSADEQMQAAKTIEQSRNQLLLEILGIGAAVTAPTVIGAAGSAGVGLPIGVSMKIGNTIYNKHLPWIIAKLMGKT